MNMKTWLVVSAATLFAVAVGPRDASAQNFPGIQAHADVPSLAACLSASQSALYNNGGDGCSGYQYATMPLMGEDGGDQSLTANVYTPDNLSDIECIWVSNDPTDLYASETGWASPPALGQSSISFTLDVYNPGSSFLQCKLNPSARLNSVVWTM
jgi:hypothetical protein